MALTQINFSRPPNFKNLKFDRLANAANDGDGAAAFMCAFMADNGMGVTPVDEALAVDWAIHGMGLEGDGGILCQTWLGMKLNAISLGHNKDAEELIRPTVTHLQKMAREGNLYAHTMMGTILAYGYGVVYADVGAAKEYLNIPSKLGCPDALTFLAHMHDGRLLPIDRNFQLNAYKRAAEMQYAPAQVQAAVILQGSDRRTEKRFLEAAAAQMYPVGLQRLGDWHNTNKTINGDPNPNLPEAFKLWQAAAERGVMGAKVSIALCFENGSYVCCATEPNGKVINRSMAEAYKIYSELLDNDGLHVHRRRLHMQHRQAILVDHRRVEGKAQKFSQDGQDYLRWPGQEAIAPRYKFG